MTMKIENSVTLWTHKPWKRRLSNREEFLCLFSYIPLATDMQWCRYADMPWGHVTLFCYFSAIHMVLHWDTVDLMFLPHVILQGSYIVRLFDFFSIYHCFVWVFFYSKYENKERASQEAETGHVSSIQMHTSLHHMWGCRSVCTLPGKCGVSQ